MENKREAAMSSKERIMEVWESEDYVMGVSKLCVYRHESELKVIWRSNPKHLCSFLKC